MQINHAVKTDASQNPNSTSAPENAIGVKPNDFMVILVAELRNQDPTQPMDPTTFMSQLVALNELQQVTQINQVIQQAVDAQSSTSN